MICGVGLDVCNISRMEKIKDNIRLLTRFFSEEERAYLSTKGKSVCASMAGLFSAKEAYVKAIGTGFTNTNLTEIQILHTQNGQPFYQLTGKAKEHFDKCAFSDIFLSITHDGDIAAAVCILSKE